MPVSSVQSGYSLIQQSQNLTKEAAQEIAQQNSREDLEFNKLEQPSDVEKEKELEATKENDKKKNVSYEQSMVKLNQAKAYNQAGVNVVQRSNEMIGTLLDTHV